MKLSIIVLVMAVCLLLVGCSAAPQFTLFGPSATPRPSPTPTFTPTPTVTPTPTPTPTPIPAARIESGDRAIFDGDWDRALVEFQTAQTASSDPEIQSAALLGIGRTQLYAGQSQEAAQTLEGLIKDYPKSTNLPYANFFLAQAYEALERHADAADAYLNYLASRSGLVDGYILDLRGDALFAAGDYSGAANDYQASLKSPSLNDPTFIQMKVARAYALSGDVQTALALYDDIYLHTDDDHTKALIDLRKGQAYTAAGQTEQATAAYLDAVNNYPTAYDSYSALLALVDAGVKVDDLNRGLVDYYAEQYGVALSALDRYLQNSPSDPGTALYYYGLTERALGNYQAAVGAWDKLIQNYPDHRFWDDAWEQKGYTQWAYLDQYSLATQTLLDFVTSAPSNPRAGEFLFDAAQVAERAGELDQAAEVWARVATEYPAYEQAHRAIFLAGITRYRQGKYLEANALFQRYLTASETIGERAAAYLWIGKSQQAQGDNTGARATWEQAASVDPTGYYSERAHDLLRQRTPFTPPQAYDVVRDMTAERAKADAWLRTTFAVPESTDLAGLGELADNAYLQRGTELWHLGMFSEARNEFEQLRQSVQSDPVLTYRLANYLYGLGVYRSATMAARQVLTLAGMDDAATMSAPAYFNFIRFGTYFSDLIAPVAEKYGFHPLFLFSVVRQESLFESFVRSSAAASGLMQVIPSTGDDIARNLGWPPNYTEADLYRPLVSLTFGADYLDKQRKAFDGDMFAALAAYNGGPGNAREWQKLAQGDPDLFLEVIRYGETRDYIRSIYEIFSIYRRIYDRTP